MRWRRYFVTLYQRRDHFALDSTCHGYSENKIRMTGITHMEIETEFDRYLMVRDHLNPVTHHPTDPIHPARGNARIIQIFSGSLAGARFKKT